jgi:hypothetical protein
LKDEYKRLLNELPMYIIADCESMNGIEKFEKIEESVGDAYVSFELYIFVEDNI